MAFEKGYGFLQSFKAVSDGLRNERKIQVFSGLLEREVVEWFLGSHFKFLGKARNQLFANLVCGYDVD